MSEVESRPRSLFEELKRRRVVRVALVYGASAFAMLQAADLVLLGVAFGAGWDDTRFQVLRRREHDPGTEP